MMGVKLNTNVCRTKIHFPFCEVGLKRQSPLDISWVVDPEKLEILELMTAVVLVTLAEETEKKGPKCIYIHGREQNYF